ncbi:general stress protein [Janibacter sp. G1551]|uniref:general stress protein n=1 Tax=Janibacter sp. G1551 TaxID=3420440 RepID=UPI003D00DFB7
MSTQPTAAGLGGNARQILTLDYPMSLAVFDEYTQAQRAVDYLSDHEFPVENVMIVGTDLKQVERVTGRLTMGRVLLGGALSGAWLGSFVGIVLSLFETQQSWLVPFVSSVLMGAVFGLVWAFLGYKATGGQRDFTSISQVVATRYEVLVEHKFVTRGRELLAEMDPMRAAQEQVRRSQEQARAQYEAQQRREAGTPEQPQA